MLRRTRLVRTRWLVDAGAPDAADEIARLLGLYPDQPALLFSRAQLEFNVRGAARAAELALAAVRTLADGDLVYRKAVFEFTGNDARTWEATTPAQAYALFRWAVDTFQKEHYRSGVFSAASKVLDEDPFYQALEETAAPWSDAERARAVTAAADELAFGDLLLTLGLDELKTHARADNWNVTWQIAQRLATDAQRYTTELLQIWDWYRENEARRASTRRRC